MPPEVIFLLCKVAVSLLIALAAVISIILGFKLLMKRRGTTPEEGVIKLLGFEARVNSLGALMMVAGIALALIAASFLPKSFERKEDGSVTIASLEAKLKEAKENIDHLESSVKGTEEQLIAVQADKARTAHQLENTSQQLAKADEELAQNKKKFDEIATVMETMKDELASADQLQELAFKHRELELKCTEYEAMIADLTQRLKDAEKKSGKAAQK